MMGHNTESFKSGYLRNFHLFPLSIRSLRASCPTFTSPPTSHIGLQRLGKNDIDTNLVLIIILFTFIGVHKYAVMPRGWHCNWQKIPSFIYSVFHLHSNILVPDSETWWS